MRVLVADDHALFRDGLVTLLDDVDGVDVAGVAATGAEAVERALELEPDLVLMDLRMPGMNGVEATRQIAERLPGTRVMVLTMFRDDQAAASARAAGAAAYLLKGIERDELLAAVGRVAAGETVFPDDPDSPGGAVAHGVPCPSCGQGNPPGSEFCVGCAQPLAGAGAARAPAATSVFVGRSAELAELVRLHAEMRDGRGGLVLVGGEPGAGKTSLLEVAAARFAAAGSTVCWGRCWEGGGAPGYWPWVQVLRSYVAQRGREAFGDAAGPWANELAPLVEDVMAPAAESERERFSLFEGMARLLQNAGRRTPLVVCLDDLHAADESSLLMLDFVTGALREAPVLVLATHRARASQQSRRAADLVARVGSHAHRILLGGLTEADVGRFIAERAGAAPSALVAAVHRATEGNPFFVDELVRLLLAEGRLEDEAAASLPLPDAVREAIRRRLAPLPDDARAVLDIAAVLGRDFQLAALRLAARGNALDVLAALGAALEHGLVREAGQPGRFSFAHALIRETLYGDLTPIDRIRLHERVGAALEELYAQNPDPHLAELAHHFVLSAVPGDVDKAVGYAARAGDRALQTLAYEEAALRYERALLALELADLPSAERRCDLLLALGAARRRSGDRERAQAAFREAADVARKLDDGGRFASAALGYGAGLGGYGFVERADEELIALLEEALERIGPTPSPKRVRLLSRLATELYFTSQVRRRNQLSAEAVASAAALEDPSLLLVALYSREWARLGPDGTRERLEAGTEIVELAGRTGDKEMAFRGHHFRLATLLELGEIGAVDQEIECCAQIAEQMGQPLYLWQTTAFRAMRALMSGNFETGGELARAALEHGKRAQLPMALVVFGAQTMYEHWGPGRLAEIEPAVKGFADHYSWAPAWRAALAFLYVETGRAPEAARHIDLLAQTDFDLPRDANWLMAMVLAGWAVAGVGDRSRAERLYELLLPYRGLDASVAAGAANAGSVEGYLGMLASTLGRLEQAVAHFDAALERNLATGNNPFVARVLLEHAAVLRRLGGEAHAAHARELALRGRQLAGDCGMEWLAQRFDSGTGADAGLTPAEAAAPAADAVTSDAPLGTAALAREGDSWRIAYAGRHFHLRHSAGLGHLATLLGRPGVEIHALALAGADATAGGDAGVALDTRAKHEYRERLDDLRGEIEEAESFGDIERAARAREQMEFIARELAAAVGLGGRDRRVAANAERARVNVTRAIKSALRRIGENDERLGAYLSACVKTGQFCSYTPSAHAPLTWEVGVNNVHSTTPDAV